MASTASKVILVLGATGETGRQVVAAALASNKITSVVEAGRKASTLPPTTPNLHKLTFIPIDYEKLANSDTQEKEKLAHIKADVVAIALGTTRAAAGSAEKFIRIDREYVLAGAKAAQVPSLEQKVVYVSSGAASSSSFFPYVKSKGLTEEGLALLGYQETIIFRPGMLVIPGGRAEHRLVEKIAAGITGVLSHITDSIQITTPVLGSAIVHASIVGIEGLKQMNLGSKESLVSKDLWTVGNAHAEKLGQKEM